jgi:sec-independent protein translocase protein TatB
MFSVPHLIIIFVVVLIVFGPEKLPDLARNLGKIMGEFRRATGDLRSTFDEHMREIEREASIRAAAAAGTGTTIAPTEQSTIGQPKIASATGTVAADAPHGWTVAPSNSPAGENASTAAAAGETSGATQAEATDTPTSSSGDNAADPTATTAAGRAGATQAEVATARVLPKEKGAETSTIANHSKEEDGGSRPA